VRIRLDGVPAEVRGVRVVCVRWVLALTFTLTPRAQFVQNFDARRPLLLGSLAPSDETIGFVQVIIWCLVCVVICARLSRDRSQARVKRHRWARRVLKSHDPVVVSVGWRRVQVCVCVCVCVCMYVCVV
jgi:hypothetical protein